MIYSVPHVAPFAGAWIEIRSAAMHALPLQVAPFAGAWIEISPLGENHAQRTVAPFAGAWIEMFYLGFGTYGKDYVAPFAGAWIEIYDVTQDNYSDLSLPSRERGLKYCMG